MKQIQLTKGAISIIDDEDFEYLSQFNWQLSSGGYAKTGTKGYFMHRVLMKAPKNKEVDHINRDKLDNRRSNLRFATRSENNRNTDIRKDNTSGYKGVNYFKPRNCWVARIQIKGKRFFLGSFDTREKAIMAYARAQTEYAY